MSIIINWSDFNVESGATVTKHRLYRSDVSRQDCTELTEHLAEFDVGTNTYHDQAVLENKLYWYRLETDTEYGTSKSQVRCMMWSNNIGEATGELVRGDWESGFTLCKKDTRMQFRDYINHQAVSLLRKYGAIFNDNFSRTEPYMYGAIIVKGELLFVSGPLSNYNTITAENSLELINNVLNDPRRFFTFEGKHYCLDVMKPEEAAIYKEMPGVPRTIGEIAFNYLDQDVQDDRKILLETQAPTETTTGNYSLLTIHSGIYGQEDVDDIESLSSINYLPFVTRLIR